MSGSEEQGGNLLVNPSASPHQQREMLSGHAHDAFIRQAGEIDPDTRIFTYGHFTTLTADRRTRTAEYKEQMMRFQNAQNKGTRNIVNLVQRLNEENSHRPYHLDYRLGDNGAGYVHIVDTQHRDVQGEVIETQPRGPWRRHYSR
jgi:hypothetical protein